MEKTQSVVTWESIAKILDRGSLLLLSNLFILLLVGRSLETLPGEATSQEVQEDVSQSLEVVTSRLFSSQMGVDTHVAGCAGQRLPLAIRDMLLSFGISVLLGHAEINNMDNISSLSVRAANKEVIGLDVTVDQVLLVDRLDSRKL